MSGFMSAFIFDNNLNLNPNYSTERRAKENVCLNHVEILPYTFLLSRIHPSIHRRESFVN
jgi:hypothetical protein